MIRNLFSFGELCKVRIFLETLCPGNEEEENLQDWKKSK